MSKPRSYYELLGVNRTATPAEIRAAYLRLMKRHHPDAASRGPGAPDLAPIFNRCYAILRDPAKRARYDAGLSRLSVAPTTSHRHSPGAPRRVSDRSSHGAALAIGICTLAVAALALNKPTEQGESEFFDTGVAWASPVPAPNVAEQTAPLPSQADLKRIASVARTISVHEAEQYSRQCFAAASRPPRPGVADACVTFDIAFLYWRKTPEAVSVFPAYFADQVVAMRHREVMSPYGRLADSRLAAIRKSAFSSLMQGILAEQSSVVSAPARTDSTVLGVSQHDVADAAAVP